MKLPPEFEAIARAARAHFERQGVTVEGTIEYAIERCYALANKPVRELTAKQWREIYTECCGACGTMEDVAKAWVTAYGRKQQEPETVTFRAARRGCDGAVDLFPADSETLIGDWKWLDHNGEPQTIEVKLP